MVLNSFFSPALIIFLSVLDLPATFQTRICELVSGFIWGSRANQISRQKLSRAVQKGGLKLGARKLALRLRLVTRLLDECQTPFWKDYLISWFTCATRLGLAVFCQNRPVSACPELDPFSAELLSACKKVRRCVTQIISTTPQILCQPIFHNPDSMHAGFPLQCKLLEESGCFLINDIMADVGLCYPSTILGRFCRDLGQGGRRWV